MSWIALTLVALAVALWAEARERPHLLRIAKPVASVGFLGFAIGEQALQSPYGLWVFVGLICSFVGDVCLIGRARAAFLAGLGAFLLAHIAYIGAFIVRGATLFEGLWALVPLSVLAFVVRAWLRPQVPAPLRTPVDVYILVITLMVASAVSAWQSGAPLLGLLGAVSFYLSDLSVARDRFCDAGPGNRLWGLPAYYLAQFLIGSTC